MLDRQKPNHDDGLLFSGRRLRNALTELSSIGFARIERLLKPQDFSELRAEAFLQKNLAKTVSSKTGTGYHASLSGLGKVGHRILAGRTMRSLIDSLFDTPLDPDNTASCYTYYQPGDFLGPHLDHPTQCVVTTILYLDVIQPDMCTKDTGLELHIYDEDPSGNPATIRAIIPTKQACLILGSGSSHWHARPVLQAGEYLTAMTACYSINSGS